MMCGEIWWIDFGTPFGSEPGFRRPVIVLQSDLLNVSKLNTTVVAVITSNLNSAEFKGNVLISKDVSGLPKDSVIVGWSDNDLDKRRFLEKVSKVPDYIVKRVVSAMLEILG